MGEAGADRDRTAPTTSGSPPDRDAPEGYRLDLSPDPSTPPFRTIASKAGMHMTDGAAGSGGGRLLRGALELLAGKSLTPTCPTGRRPSPRPRGSRPPRLRRGGLLAARSGSDTPSSVVSDAERLVRTPAPRTPVGLLAVALYPVRAPGRRARRPPRGAPAARRGTRDRPSDELADWSGRSCGMTPLTTSSASPERDRRAVPYRGLDAFGRRGRRGVLRPGR